MDTESRILDSQKQILAHLVEWEQQVAVLYDLYAAQLPEQTELWKRMAAEERAHALVVGSLESEVNRGTLLWGLGLFTPERMANNVSAVRQAITDAQVRARTPREALATSLAIERGQLEAGFYDAVDCASERFAQVAAAMRLALKRHAEHIERQLFDATA